MLIIIAALMPVFTLQSVEGRIFRPLALTYSFALVGALVFALTLVPALCAALFRPRHARLAGAGLGRARPRRATAGRSSGCSTGARRCSSRSFALLPLGVASIAHRLGTEFLPELDEGDIQLFVEMPPSIALEQGQEILLEVRRRMLAFPEVAEDDERAGPARGRHRQRERQHERDVHPPEAGAGVARRATTRSA